MKNCPYCEIKANAKIKTVYDSINPVDGTCKCGAYIDRGQYCVKVNGYTDIYNGAIRLLDEMVSEFNKILDYAGIDIREYFDDDEININLSSTKIAEMLFLPYYGSTTKSNFLNAIGIEEDEHSWTLSKSEECD